MFEGSKTAEINVRRVVDCVHLFASEHHSGHAREKEEPQVLGKRALAPGRAMR